AMPGEMLSCIGCHESRDMAPPMKAATAFRRAPSTPEPFYGPMRGFSFAREVQPVLDAYCISCHDGSREMDANGRDKQGRYTAANRIIGTGRSPTKTFREAGIPDLRNPKKAYEAIHPFLRRNGPEGDYHLLTPLEFHANTSELFQMLEKGHHNVNLDAEAWDRLQTWADLNVPRVGTWSEARKDRIPIIERRIELAREYGGVDYNPEEIVPEAKQEITPIVAEPLPQRSEVDVQKSVVEAAAVEVSELDLGNGVAMKLVTVPAGEFSMGSNDETPVEQPVSRVQIDKPYQMGAMEVTLRQYRQFDPDYLNGVYDMHYKDQVKRGYYMNDMDFPVIRVSWQRAQAFCEWLSKQSGRTVSLPTEAQWEWACRAGTTTPLSYGDLASNFSRKANLSDVTVRQMAVRGVNPRPIQNPDPEWDFKLKDARSNDGALHLAEVGSYEPNAWGLYDMHGNVAEWTQSDYTPYPYRDSDGRNDDRAERKVVRGGSWHDRPYRATATFRLGFPKWQRVYNTGFRVVVLP
ncbi:MAG: SUMF1/EgtB/PvdO family nonheme iron enzyme, partial [Verrucomicrobia bacterium]|nr:SUMF1/EgtB/PvdO family nonheme iron enzyme [Verrucomicrobiota bacterium]